MSLMDFYANLALVLAGKCHWHEEIAQAIAEDNKAHALSLAEGLLETAHHAERLRIVWRTLWLSTNKPYGFEILDGRMGALCARLETARSRVLNWIENSEDETLPELREEVLPYTLREGGTLFGSYAINEIVSACKIDR